MVSLLFILSNEISTNIQLTIIWRVCRNESRCLLHLHFGLDLDGEPASCAAVYSRQ
jgi:hypothetical protein